MQCSEDLRCLCLSSIFKHAEFLLRSIGMWPENKGLSRKKFRAFDLRCTPGNRHNDIAVLIVGNQIVW